MNLFYEAMNKVLDDCIKQRPAAERECFMCRGDGYITTRGPDMLSRDCESRRCYNCAGTGYVSEEA